LVDINNGDLDMDSEEIASDVKLDTLLLEIIEFGNLDVNRAKDDVFVSWVQGANSEFNCLVLDFVSIDKEL
jgi:hypothetical protein